MKKQSEIHTVIELMGRWLSQVRLSSALTFYDINKISEDFSCKLLNEIYTYELINLNSEKANFPGIDLGDKTKALIAFQITSRIDGEKIRNTLRTFVNNKYDKIFTNGIRFLILNQESVKFGKQNPKKIYGPFKKNHVITDKDIIKEIDNIYNNNPAKFTSIKRLFENEFGFITSTVSPKSVTSQSDLEPETYLFIFGQENSFFPFADGRKMGKMKISLKPIQASRDLHDVQVPANLFEWKYPPEIKLFTIYCENRREAIDSNIKIDINFSMGTSIQSVDISNENRMLILTGGKKSSNFISIHIPQLLPGERQELRIVTKGKEIEKVKAWSEKIGSFGDIFIYDIVFDTPKEMKILPENVKKICLVSGNL